MRLKLSEGKKEDASGRSSPSGRPGSETAIQLPGFFLNWVPWLLGSSSSSVPTSPSRRSHWISAFCAYLLRQLTHFLLRAEMEKGGKR